MYWHEGASRTGANETMLRVGGSHVDVMQDRIFRLVLSPLEEVDKSQCPVSTACDTIRTS